MHPDLISAKLELLLASVEWEASFESQVSSIFNKIVVEVSGDQSDTIETIKQDLETAIHIVYPDAAVTVYGSARSGLGLVCSDVDLSINIKYTEEVFHAVNNAIKTNKTFKQTKSFNDKLKLITSIHAPTNTEFDLTFNNEGAVATTDLLAHIMNINPKVKQLTLLIKIWSKIHCLMGPPHLSSIAWYMLIIFYLQQLGMVPSICGMMDKDNPKYVDGYNMAIHKKNIHGPQGDKTLLQLLGGFFVFYNEINWDKFAVCPFTALLIPKTNFFENIHNLPVEYEDYKQQISQSYLKTTRMVIQHALNHSRNCTYSIKKTEFAYFRDKIKSAAAKYTNYKYICTYNSFLREILQPRVKGKIRKRTKEHRFSVSGFSATTTKEELIILFSKYGEVEVENMDQGIAIVKFKDGTSVKSIISDSNIQFKGQQIQVNRFTHASMHIGIYRRPKNKNKTSVPEPIMPPSEIDLTGDFDSQLKSLLLAVTLDLQDIEQLNHLYSDVESVLQTQWPDCKVIPFGSISYGLGLESSNADCYISGAWSDDRSAVIIAEILLKRRPDLFIKILALSRATNPIVKSFHISTLTNCDISFKSSLGTQNTKLIAFLLQSDAKLIPMSVVIKYWGKVHSLTGTGRMSNYALTMLVIFYLQQPPLNMLPAVHTLQNDSNNCKMIDGWNTGFVELPFPNDNKPQWTIPKLLAGFFHFYANFDFTKFVVCPYLGRPIKKKLFKKPHRLPEEFSIYKSNIKDKICVPLPLDPICVQDPFEHCRNVTTRSTVSKRLLRQIKEYVFECDVTLKFQNDYNNLLKNILLRNAEIRPMTSKQFTLNKILKATINSDWYHCLPYIFKVFLTMELQTLNFEETGELVAITYTLNINRETWERSQRGRLGANKQVTRLNSKFAQIGDSNINLRVIIKANTKEKRCTIIFTLKDVYGILDDFTAYISVKFPKWFRYLHKNDNYKQAVALRGYQFGTEDLTVNTDLCSC